jgi:hypothetical protein
LIDRPDRGSWIHAGSMHDGGGSGHTNRSMARAARVFVQGSTARGPLPLRPDGSTDTGMPVASRRAPGDGIGMPSRPGTEAPEATGPGPGSLDVISVPRSLAAPSGKTNGARRARVGSTRLSTRLGQGYPVVSTSYAPLWTCRGQILGPMAGRCVASAIGGPISRRGRTSRYAAGGRSSRRSAARSNGRREPPRRRR